MSAPKGAIDPSRETPPSSPVFAKRSSRHYPSQDGDHELESNSSRFMLKAEEDCLQHDTITFFHLNTEANTVQATSATSPSTLISSSTHNDHPASQFFVPFFQPDQGERFFTMDTANDP
jgi:hypothetical protein